MFQFRCNIGTRRFYFIFYVLCHLFECLFDLNLNFIVIFLPFILFSSALLFYLFSDPGSSHAGFKSFLMMVQRTETSN
jgi:hypothetical protein